ncbi:hypothetical protein JCM10212_006368 [Sporobolomyces blumeae]
MSSNLVGAPVSKGILVTLCCGSLLAAITTTQHYFNVPCFGHPHIFRDHQVWRFATRWCVWSNSADLLVAVFVQWYSAAELERIWGSRKFASFLVVMAGVTTVVELVALVLFARSGLDTLPAGPFALTFAVVYQSYRTVPVTYTFELFHPILTLSNRYAFYAFCLLLATSQPPRSLILAVAGIVASTLYTSNALPLRVRQWRIPKRLYSRLGQALTPLFGRDRPVRRGTAVTFDGALLQSLGADGASQIIERTVVGRAATARTAGEPRQTAPAPDAATAGAPPPRPERRAPPSVPPPPPRTSASRIPPIVGASFLSQWQAGLSGGPAQPSNEQIAELSNVFPHATRQEVIRALQENDLSVSRAAAALVAQ